MATKTEKVRKYILWGVLTLVALVAPAKVAQVLMVLKDMQ